MSLLLVYAIHSQKEFFNDPSFRIKAKTECSLHLCPYGQWPCQYYLFFLPRYHKYFSVEMFSVDILFLWSYWALRSCASYSEQPDLEIKVHTISDKNLTAVAALKAAFIFPTNDPMHRPVELEFCHSVQRWRSGFYSYLIPMCVILQLLKYLDVNTEVLP